MRKEINGHLMLITRTVRTPQQGWSLSCLLDRAASSGSTRRCMQEQTDQVSGASLGIGMWGARKGTAELELELALLELWCVNGVEGELWGIRSGCDVESRVA